MNNEDDTKPHRNSWPEVTVVSGWVFTNGYTQMGFALSATWAPGRERIARGPEARRALQEMSLPEAIQLWLRGLFVQGLIEAVTIQWANERWRVHIASPLQLDDHEKLVAMVDELLRAAGLPVGSAGQRISDISDIMGRDARISESDALTHWLGGRIKRAVTHIFAVSRA